MTASKIERCGVQIWPQSFGVWGLCSSCGQYVSWRGPTTYGFPDREMGRRGDRRVDEPTGRRIEGPTDRSIDGSIDGVIHRIPICRFPRPRSKYFISEILDFEKGSCLINLRLWKPQVLHILNVTICQSLPISSLKIWYVNDFKLRSINVCDV